MPERFEAQGHMALRIACILHVCFCATILFLFEYVSVFVHVTQGIKSHDVALTQTQ